MIRIALSFTLALAGFSAQAQTAPIATPQAAPDPAPDAPISPASYQPSDGTFGPHSTCETATPPVGKNYKDAVDRVLASYPGYTIFDQHNVVCGKKKALVLVLISRDGSKPSRLHAIDTTKP